jgi:hypothetical protein
MPILLAISIGLLGLTVIIIIRNNRVYRFRMGMLDAIQIDDPDFYRKLDRFNSVSYNQMVFQFWRPLGSFYNIKENFNG